MEQQRGPRQPFDPSMMVHFRKRLTDDDLRRINELVVQRGKDMLLEELEQRSADDDQDGGSPPLPGKLSPLLIESLGA